MAVLAVGAAALGLNAELAAGSAAIAGGRWHRGGRRANPVLINHKGPNKDPE
jgi:hypothetical protein